MDPTCGQLDARHVAQEGDQEDCLKSQASTRAESIRELAESIRGWTCPHLPPPALPPYPKLPSLADVGEEHAYTETERLQDVLAMMNTKDRFRSIESGLKDVVQEAGAALLPALSLLAQYDPPEVLPPLELRHCEEAGEREGDGDGRPTGKRGGCVLYIFCVNTD